VGIYGHRLEGLPVFNHGPLAAWLLAAINALHDRGIAGYPFLIRAPACLADFVTAVLLFELVRRVRPLREALLAAALVAFSPVLLVVSGFHGNTDPVVVMFVLAAAYLLLVRRSPLAASIAFGLAVSVKLVPLVLVPALLLAAMRLRRAAVLRFLAGGAVVFAVLWVPV